MIEKTPSFKTSDGNVYATLEIAQRAELLKLLMDPEHNAEVSELHANAFLNVMFKRLDEVKEILRCTGRKPRKAKGNGKARTRKVAKEVVGE